MKRSHVLLSAILLGAGATAPAGCGKAVSLGTPGIDLGPSAPSGPSTPPIPGYIDPTTPLLPEDPIGPPLAPIAPIQSCAPSDRLSWTFIQPQPLDRPADILFVVDTSRSLDAERARIAVTLPTFIAQLPPQADYRVGVMLAHGGASDHSGRLYPGEGGVPVLDSRKLSQASLQRALRRILSDLPQDEDVANGEALLYSVLRSLQSDRLAEIRDQGFYRPNAALSVIFVTDENDICFRPELHGYTQFPDFVPSASGTETRAYARHCLGTDGRLKITPGRVLKKLRDLKSSSRLAFGAIVHEEPTQVPQGGEDSIGHGILELVKSTLDGRSFEISAQDYVPGLAEMGRILSTHLKLNVAFTLDGSASILASTVSTRVDGRPVATEFDSTRREARIPARDAGRAGSVVEVSACPAGR